MTFIGEIIYIFIDKVQNITKATFWGEEMENIHVFKKSAMSSAKAFLSKHLAFLAIFYYSFLGRWGNHLYSHSSNLKALGFKKDLNIRFGIFFKCLLSKYCKIFLLICHTCCGSPSIVTNRLFKKLLSTNLKLKHN